MSGQTRIGRRAFVRGVAGAAAFALPELIPASALGRGGAVAPSNRIVMGAIGVGGKGMGNMQTFAGQKDVRMVAVCDVRAEQRTAAVERVNELYGSKDCKGYVDFRELLARPDIQAVSIASPDHWHILHSLEAARNGKDMYTEKPLGLSVVQGKVLRETIQRYGRVFQFGTQQRSSEQYRRACDLALGGKLGKVHTIRVGSPPSGSGGNPTPMPVPEGLDYDLWLGPAPFMPYTRDRVFGTGWYDIYDYALGMIAGYGIHDIICAQWGNGTDDTGPIEIEATGTLPTRGLKDCVMTWDAAMKYTNGATLYYSNENDVNRRGVKFEGSEGWVFAARSTGTGGSYRIVCVLEAEPKSLLDAKPGPNDVRLPVSNNHCRDFLDCVKTRAKTVCPIEAAVRADTICHLADIAVRLNRKLRWDPEREQFVGDNEANARLDRALRAPWRV